MNILQRIAKRCVALVLLLVLMLSFGTVATATTDSSTDSEISSGSSGGTTTDTQAPKEPDRIHAAYSFDDRNNLTAEVGKTYPLSSKEFGSALVSGISGHRNGAMSGYIALDDRLFDTLEQFSVGFWTAFSRSDAQSKDTIFLVFGANSEKIEVSFKNETNKVKLYLTVSDGKKTASCSQDVTEVFGEDRTWAHVAFTYKKSGSVSLLTLYVNGKSSSSSISTTFVDLSGIRSEIAAFYGIPVDELYLTDYALEPAKVSSLMNQAVSVFYSSESKEIAGGSSEPEGGTVDTPAVNAHSYTWAAYLFDGTFAAGSDFHSGDIPAIVDGSCVMIDSANLTSKFGNALIRREGTAPAQYMKLDGKLTAGQSSFTFACWVYRNGKGLANDECLFDLNGTGTLRFAPYAASEKGTPAAYIEYTDSRGNVQHKTLADGNPADARNKWVHYALTVSSNGDIAVFVNGVLCNTFASGAKFSSLALADCHIVTGASVSDTTRTAVDEVYMTPKALSAAEIRKIHAYGLSRYTTEVLPDPAPGGDISDPSENPYTPDATDVAEDAFDKTGSIVNGFIGTTFDNRDNIGFDWNNGATAVLTGGRLTKGVSSYGLSLDGQSFLRYPSGILDGCDALTISMSYYWEGANAGDARAQRLFDFSRKAASVANPEAYLFLEMGTGASGLRLGLSDGISSTYLSCDYNAIETWTRISVTLSEGQIVIYLDDEIAATGYTDVNLAQIYPNFCYIGRSGVKGDPAFQGIVDEVYIAPRALSGEEIAKFSNGIASALKGSQAEESDFWGMLIQITVVVAVVLVLAIIVVIVVIILKKDKKGPEEEAPIPVSFTPSEDPPLGPRAARRARREAGLEDPGDTVKFRKVDLSSDLSEGAEQGSTTQFRKISDD